jgi:hypothetical protein
MEVRLVDLKFVVGRHFHIHIPLGVGSLCHTFFLGFAGLDFN